ncbi:MAG: hypothetical protein ABFR90_05170 [Planctomycetota bacterium]
MTNGAVTGGAVVAAQAAIANAIKASGAIIHVEPNEFLNLLQRNGDPLVVLSQAGMFRKNQYLTAYKGLIFYTKAATPLILSSNVELIQAKKIWIPSM